MNRKYEFTDETVTINERILHRIRSVKNFEYVTVGELGGFVEKEENLSHDGNAWVYGNARVLGEAFVSGDAHVYGIAKVCGNAHVCNDAKVCDSAAVYGNATVCGSAIVGGNAKVCDDVKVCDDAVVCGNAIVHDNARVCDAARVCGSAIVCGNAIVSDKAQVSDDAAVYDNAKIYGHSYVYGYARVYGDAQIYDYAKVFEAAHIYGDAHVSNNERIRGGTHCITNINSDLEESIRVQTGLIPVNGEVIAYKQVQKDLTSFYDPDFKYEVGKIAEAKDPDESVASCTSGLHFSNANYWNGREVVAKSTFLIARIKLEDIITVQEGKIRCRKAEIIGKYDIKV